MEKKLWIYVKLIINHSIMCGQNRDKVMAKWSFVKITSSVVMSNSFLIGEIIEFTAMIERRFSQCMDL